MKKLYLTLSVVAALGLGACQTNQSLMNDMGGILSQASSYLGQSGDVAGLSATDIAAAFRQALSIGSGNVVTQLGQKGGFNDPKIHIPLPGALADIQSNMRKIGLSRPLDELENRLNLAAEEATPYAKDIFLSAISQLTFDDVMRIYNGSSDAATQYFKHKTSAQLTEKMSPIIRQAISKTGVMQAYSSATKGLSAAIPLPDPQANLTSYVNEKGLDALFYYLAQEEKAIRQDPVRQTTALLKKVFGTSQR